MSRRVLIVALTLIAYFGCSDLPTSPTRSPVAAAGSGAPLVAPPGASSICVASVRDFVDITAQLNANPDDPAIQAAHATQSEITADVCN